MSTPPGSAPSVEERIGEIEERMRAYGYVGTHAEFLRSAVKSGAFTNAAADRFNKIAALLEVNVPWLIAELRARDEALREARKDAARIDRLEVEASSEAITLHDGTLPMMMKMQTRGLGFGPRLMRTLRDAIDGLSLARTEGGDEHGNV